MINRCKLINSLEKLENICVKILNYPLKFELNHSKGTRLFIDIVCFVLFVFVSGFYTTIGYLICCLVGNINLLLLWVFLPIGINLLYLLCNMKYMKR